MQHDEQLQNTFGENEVIAGDHRADQPSHGEAERSETPPQALPAAAAREAAARLLNDRVQSGNEACLAIFTCGFWKNMAYSLSHIPELLMLHHLGMFLLYTLLTSVFRAGRFASSSRQSGSGPSQEGGQNQQTARFALGQRQGMPLSVYFAQRKLLVNSTESFRIFCAALALLQVRFAQTYNERRMAELVSK